MVKIKFLTNIIQSLAIILCVALISFAQTDSKNKSDGISQSEIKWVRIESPSKDWSFAIPNGYLADNEGEGYRVIFSNQKTFINIFIDDKGNGKERLKSGFSNLSAEDLEKFKFFEKGKFIGVYLKNEDEKLNKGSYTINLASNSGLSNIRISTRNLDNEIFQQFIQSIRLNGEPLFISANLKTLEEVATINIRSLKTDKSILDALNVEDSKQKKLIMDSVAEDNKLNSDTDEDDKSDAGDSIYDKPLIILRKPFASYSETGRQRRISGQVKLKVQFLASGRIGEIKLISSLEKSLDDKAFKAAKKIKFLPPQINGKPVDVQKLIVYSFKVL
ncbi:MAG: TonB family protein [Aridibacter sp.]